VAKIGFILGYLRSIRGKKWFNTGQLWRRYGQTWQRFGAVWTHKNHHNPHSQPENKDSRILKIKKPRPKGQGLNFAI
jgi:hypothetical protein